MNELLRITVQAPASLADEATLLLTELTPHGWQEDRGEDGSTTFTVHLEQTTAAEDVIQALTSRLPEARVARDSVENKEWALAWREFFTPVDAGGVFTVLPPWLADQAPADRIPIVIEPKTAFGTGHHGTTALCLAAVAGLHGAGRIAPGMAFLDLGTGSGILGLGCCLLGLSGIGLDIDPLAIENAVENKAANGVGEAFELSVGSLEALAPERTFDLVLANILAGPLKVMASRLLARVRPGGVLVLSGILAEQADAVAEVYMGQGLAQPRREQAGEWVALIWD